MMGHVHQIPPQTVPLGNTKKMVIATVATSSVDNAMEAVPTNVQHANRLHMSSILKGIANLCVLPDSTSATISVSIVMQLVRNVIPMVVCLVILVNTCIMLNV